MKREETPTQSRGMRCSGWAPLFPFPPSLSFSVGLQKPREGPPLPPGPKAQGGPTELAALSQAFLASGQIQRHAPPTRWITGFSGCRRAAGLGVNHPNSPAREPSPWVGEGWGGSIWCLPA